MGQVSVVIPVGPGHESVVQEAIESVKAQTVSGVECIVVNDSGLPLETDGVLMLTSDRRNVAYARNIGIQASTGDAFVCLDADDILHEQYVEKTLQAYTGSKWVYVDYFLETAEGIAEACKAKDWDAQTLWRSGISFVTCLYPKAAWQSVGGFDETIGHEDWEFHLRLASAGFAGVHLAERLVTYRRWLSQRSLSQPTDKSRAVIQGRYPLSSLMLDGKTDESNDWPVLVYTGKSERELIIAGRELSYKVDRHRNVVSVHPGDVPYFMGIGLFRPANENELQLTDNLLRDLSLGHAL